MTTYSPAVEAWRPYVEKYLPGDPDKWLYVIDGESGGNPTIPGDSGAAYGLFQSHHIPAGASVEQQFQDAARLYKNRVAAGGTGFEDWGEGTENMAPFDETTGRGRFGSLGNNPYGGGGAPRLGGNVASTDWYNRYAAVYPRYAALKAKYDQDAFAADQINSQTGRAIGPGTVMTPSEVAEFSQLSGQVQDLEDEAAQAGIDAKDAIEQAKWQHATDPASIAAENAAASFARQMAIRQDATSLANNRLKDQTDEQAAGRKGLTEYTQGHAAGDMGSMPKMYLPTADDLYGEAVATVKKGLPDVPDMPGYTAAQRAAGGPGPNVPGARAAATAAEAPRLAKAKAIGAEQDAGIYGQNNPDYIDRNAGGGKAPSLTEPSKISSVGGGKFWGNITGSILSPKQPAAPTLGRIRSKPGDMRSLIR